MKYLHPIAITIILGGCYCLGGRQETPYCNSFEHSTFQIGDIRKPNDLRNTPSITLDTLADTLHIVHTMSTSGASMKLVLKQIGNSVFLDTVSSVVRVWSAAGSDRLFLFVLKETSIRLEVIARNTCCEEVENGCTSSHSPVLGTLQVSLQGMISNGSDKLEVTALIDLRTQIDIFDEC